MVCVQNESLRAVSASSMPTRDLNHCRLSSTMEIAAIGTCSRDAAIRVMRSNASLALVSSSPVERTKNSRSCS
ncbi:hypothetical protein D3C85_1808970 [compost metagenome]